MPDTPGAPAEAPTILVVDDDPEIRSFVVEGLLAAGYRVVEAADGQEAIEVAKEHNPSLMVLDLSMPRMHGFQVCLAVRGDPRLRPMKIIVTSGKSYPVDIRAAKDAGADQYLVKPYGFQQLVDAVERLLEGA